MTCLKLAVIGHPIAHSKSPMIHTHWLAEHGLEGSYDAINIAPDNLEGRLKEIIDAGYHGFNATIPHKEKLLTLCDNIDDTAKAIGAVNTVRIDKGRVIGTNTDSYGLIENIRSNAPDFDFSGKTALVLGAGGAARAAIYGLQDAGIGKIILSNRTQEKAELLKNQFCHPERSASEVEGSQKPQGDSSATPQNDIIEVISWNDKEAALPQTDLLINTTSLGMDGQSALELSLDNLKTGALVNDIVYAPLMTPLLKQAETLGHHPITGIGMLLHQAALSFTFWTGIKPEVTKALAQEVLG